MKIYHVKVERDGEWFAAQALEDQSVFTQGKSLDEIIVNVREVVRLLYETDDVQVELILPPDLDVSTQRPLAG